MIYLVAPPHSRWTKRVALLKGAVGNNLSSHHMDCSTFVRRVHLLYLNITAFGASLGPFSSKM